MAKPAGPRKNFPLAVIGGSGVYSIEDLREVREVSIKNALWRSLRSRRDRCAGRNSRRFFAAGTVGHRINPSEVNYRANVYALKTLGAEQIISVSACGSLREELKPRDMVFPDQIFDRTKSRPSTFFRKRTGRACRDGVPLLSGALRAAVSVRLRAGIPDASRGTYVCMEGPQFSTLAESRCIVPGFRHRHDESAGGEARPGSRDLLFRGGAGHRLRRLESRRASQRRESDRQLDRHTANVKQLLKTALPQLARTRSCDCASGLQYALLTDRKLVPRRQKKRCGR